jgi:hypothetical protein
MQQTLWVVGKVPNGRVAKTYSAFATGQCLRDNLAALANLPLLVIAYRTRSIGTPSSCNRFTRTTAVATSVTVVDGCQGLPLS